MEKKFAILGLGYVGLPLDVKLSSYYKVIGFDISSLRVSQLHKGIDITLEVEKKQLKKSLKKNFSVTNCSDDFSNCDIYIATVPTPLKKIKNLILVN